jgi:hypothetical protein
MKYLLYIYIYIYKYISKSESAQDLFQTSSIRKCKKNRKSKIFNSSIVLFQEQEEEKNSARSGQTVSVEC